MSEKVGIFRLRSTWTIEKEYSRKKNNGKKSLEHLEELKGRPHVGEDGD